jgi:hypothetical protein
MIDWVEVLANAIWIVGCALALAVVSYANWTAGIRDEKMRVALGRPRVKTALGLAGTLFCLGLAATSHTILEVVIWLALTGLFAIQTIKDWREFRHSTVISARPKIDRSS